LDDLADIMKTYLGVMIVALAVGGSLAISQASAFSQEEEPKVDMTKKVEVLEIDLIATRQKAEAVATELAQTKATLARIVGYLDAQAKSAAALADTLDQSEQAGFTAGINPNSRMILLSGWREHLVALQTDVPVMPVAAKVDEGKPGAKKQ
jgi:hypothetical protein